MANLRKKSLLIDDVNDVKVDVSEKILDVLTAAQLASETIAFSNPMVGAIDANGSLVLPISQAYSGTLTDLVPDDSTGTSIAKKVREHVLVLGHPKVSQKNIWYDEDIATYGSVSGWVDSVVVAQTNKLIIQFDKENYAQIKDAAIASATTASQITYGFDASTSTGEETYDEIVKQHLYFSKIVNDERDEGFEKTQMLTIVNDTVITKLNKLGLIDLQNLPMLANGLLAEGRINGVAYVTSKRLPSDVSIMTITTGEYGTFGHIQILTPFMDLEVLDKAGMNQFYYKTQTSTSTSQVIFDYAIAMASSDTAPVLMNVNKSSKKDEVK